MNETKKIIEAMENRGTFEFLRIVEGYEKGFEFTLVYPEIYKKEWKDAIHTFINDLERIGKIECISRGMTEDGKPYQKFRKL